MTPHTPTKAPVYRPDIDGLRAVAVVSVVAYHAGLPWVTGGFAGVDIFFVISGYLITSLILKETVHGQFSLRQFYIRRARRLFPALFVVLAASAVLAWWLLMPSEMEDFGESLATAAAFSSNLMFWSEAGYFDGPSEFKPLLHTWSLAIEEQYYLLFPLLLIAAKRAGHYLGLFGLVALASLALSQWYVERAPAAAFFLLPHRLWELMIGSLLAALVVTRPDWLSRLPASARIALAICGLGSIAFCLLRFAPSTAFPGLNALWPTLGTAAIICAGTGGSTPINQALGTRAIAAVGLISYSLYLWHWPVLVFTKLYLINPPTPLQTLAAISLSIGLAWLSWRFIERPFRASLPHLTASRPRVAWQFSLPDRAVLPASLLCIAPLIGFGLLLDKTDGMPGRLPAHVAALADVANDKPPERKRCTGIAAKDVSLERLCRIGSAEKPPEFIVWGDSHAMTLVPQFEDLANKSQLAGLNATSNGCAALLETWRPGDDPNQTCAAFNAAVFALIQSTPSIKRVILAGRWAIYAEGTRYKHESGTPLLLVDRQSSLPYNHSNLSLNRTVFHRAVNRTLTALKGLEGPAREIVLISSIPEIGWDTPNVIARAELLDRELTIAPTLLEHRQRQSNVDETFAQLHKERGPYLLQMDPAEHLCDQQVCRAVLDNQPLYVDEDHLSSRGSAALKPLLRDALHATSVRTPPINQSPL